LRNVLGCFLFSDEDQFKKIKVLSGGEKSRVALAKTLISEANFLLLDEPTNHLDFISENILIQALQQYKGSFVVVSHNRHFVSQIANKIWYIEDKQIKEYPGTYEEYEYWKKKNETSEPAKPEPPKEKVQKKQDDAAVKTPSHQTKLKELEKNLKRIESQIENYEGVKASLESELSSTEIYNNAELLKKKQNEFESVSRDLNAATAEWEKIVDEIDKLKTT
jgi:ATP-binding cassette, subfamily F, member 3